MTQPPEAPRRRPVRRRTQPDRAPHGPAGRPDDGPRWKKWLRDHGILAAVTGTVAATLVLTLVPELFEVSAVKDGVRSVKPGGAEDMRHTVRFQDPGYQLVTPAGVTLTAAQRSYLEHWKLGDPASRSRDGYDLERVMRELRAEGAANPDELFLRITLEGHRNQPVFVDDVRPVDIRRTAPLKGAFLDLPPQDGGETLKMMFDFDEAVPRAREAVPAESSGSLEEFTPGGLFFHSGTLTVKDAEQDSIVIKSVATRKAVTFRIRIDYRIGDTSRHLTVDNGGRPFALTPVNCTRRGRLTENGYVNGRVSYEDMWQMGEDAGVDRVPDPGSHEHQCLDRSGKPEKG